MARCASRLRYKNRTMLQLQAASFSPLDGSIRTCHVGFICPGTDPFLVLAPLPLSGPLDRIERNHLLAVSAPKQPFLNSRENSSAGHWVDTYLS